MAESNQRRGARKAILSGWNISPIKPGEKGGVGAYLKKTWKNTINNINDMESFPEDCNWSFSPGINQYIVFDIDMKNNKNGLSTFSGLAKKHGQLPQTLTVKTPSGGFHYYFKLPIGLSHNSLPEGTDVLGEGVDVKNLGYVVLFGGETEGSYEIIIDNPEKDLKKLPVLPQEWIRLLSSKKSKVKEKTGESVLPEGAVTEGNRDNFLISKAGVLRKQGFNQEVITASLMKISETYCHPHDPEMVREKVNSIMKYDPEVDYTFIDQEIKHAEAKSKFGSLDSLQTIDGVLVREADVEPRKWVFGSRFLKDFITVTISPGGTGKSTLALAEAIGIATGLRKIGGREVHDPGSVWYHTTEDPLMEMKRKMLAYKQYYNLTTADFKGNVVLLSSSQDNDMTIAVEDTKNSLYVVDVVKQRIVEKIRAFNIKLLIIDPFVRIHSVNENDNSKIDKVVKQFSDIAKETHCAIHLIHHPPKSAARGNFRGDQFASRGAGSLMGAARLAHTLDVMNEEEAEAYGFSPVERMSLVRLDTAKSNITKWDGRGWWYRRISVDMPHLCFTEEASGEQGIGLVVPNNLVLTIDLIKLISDILGEEGRMRTSLIAEQLFESFKNDSIRVQSLMAELDWAEGEFTPKNINRNITRYIDRRGDLACGIIKVTFNARTCFQLKSRNDLEN